MQRRAFVVMLAGVALPRPVLAGSLDHPPPDLPLWWLVAGVDRWAETLPAPGPADVTVAVLRLSTACRAFAQGVAISLNHHDVMAARSGLDTLTRALRHVLALAERVDPAWRARINVSPLDAPDLPAFLETIEVMSLTFHAFVRASGRFEWIARGMAADPAG